MLHILVILYKKEFDQSETLVSLLSVAKKQILKNVRLIIWDNSPNAISNDSLSELTINVAELAFKHTPQNLSISKIYNEVAAGYLKPQDYLLLLDHDTKVTEAYITEVLDKINSSEKPLLLLPRVLVQGVLESPAYQYVLFSKKLKDPKPGIQPSKSVTAINSGMVISGVCFSDGFRYDERLAFYGTDTYFMFNFTARFKDYYLLNSTLDHNLNLLSNPSLAEKVKVFKAIKTSNLIIYSSNPWYKILAAANNLIISCKYSVRYLSLQFFK